MWLTKSSWLSLLIILSLLSLSTAIRFGPVDLPLRSILEGHGTALQETILFHLRLPRALNAFVVGGLLALAGALMQVLLRNPLADPYVLGVSGGSAVATLLAMLAGVSGFWLTGYGFLGAWLSIFLVFIIARDRSPWSSWCLLLTGVVLATGWGAVISLILILSPNQSLHGLLFWLMGDINATSPPLFGGIVLAMGLLISLVYARALTILCQGELTAKSLGINSQQTITVVYLLSALCTATAVSLAGTVGFVGLIVPHLCRLMVGSDYRFILPGAILLGGSLLVMADTLAEVVWAPQSLPVGIFTAFLGIPVFLFLLFRRNKAIYP